VCVCVCVRVSARGKVSCHKKYVLAPKSARLLVALHKCKNLYGEVCISIMGNSKNYSLSVTLQSMDGVGAAFALFVVAGLGIGHEVKDSPAW
jgi:hypothetical protein